MSSAPEDAPPPPGEPAPGRAAFVDRDGTINVDTHYLPGPEKVELHQGVTEGLVRLRAGGYRVIVVTNQSGIARGFYTAAAVEAIHARLRELLARGGARIDAFYYCPHAPGDGCACRKPGTLLFEQAARELRIDLPRSAVIGDRWLDVEAGRKLGLTTVFVPEPGALDRYPEERARARTTADIYATSFLEGCERLLARG